jgi:MFS family permease
LKSRAAIYQKRFRIGEDAGVRLKPQVLLLGLASLLNDASSEMIFPLLPVFLTTTLGATPVVVGLIEGAADGLASILKYFAGSWSDRLQKRKPLVVSGYALAAASRALIAMAGAWPSVLTARLIDRTGKGIRSAPRDAMISDVTPPEDRGRAYGFHRALDHTGAIVGPLLAMLVLWLGFSVRQTFFAAIIPGAIAALLLVFLLREAPRVLPAKTKERAPMPARALVAISLFSLANSSDAFLILKAHEAGVTAAMLPLLWAAHHVIKSLFSTRAGALSDRIDRRKLLCAGWMLYALIYLLFPLATSLELFFVLFILYALPGTLTEGAERAWIADLVPASARGKSFGMYYLASGLCVLAGTALFGLIYQQVSPRAAFGTGAALAVAAAVVVATSRPVVRAA